MNDHETPISQNFYSLHRPEWNHWKAAKSIRLWHIVALACDLDPYQFTVFGTSELDRLFQQLPKQFEELLIVAKGGIAAGGILKLNSLSEKGIEESEIAPSNFGAWAKSIRYALPAQFPWQDNATLPLSREWPWGRYETKLLLDLAEAAKRLWTLYDPSDPSSAPTNETVIEFLQNRGVSKRTAEVMATILRADGLPTGPR